MNVDIELNCVMVIFGGTGDLTHRKLMPALYNLQVENMLPEHFAVVSVGRREKTQEQYRSEVYESIKQFSRFKLDESHWEALENRIFYEEFDFSEDAGYGQLDKRLKILDEKYKTGGNRIYYLAVTPEAFDEIVQKLDEHHMAENKNSWQRVVIEKPFGRDLKTAQYLNEQITKVFTEDRIYRIDHYLGKEMIQNIMVIRFANALFEPLWNNKYIDNIQITSSETVGVENRGGYYEQSGALRDMLQNHMLQLLTLTAMEPPINLETESIRDEKVKVLKSLRRLGSENIKSNVIRGQYGKGIFDDKMLMRYREEPRVSPQSNTETFLAVKLCVENFRWAGVPIYIRTGKRMPVKTTDIIIEFKPLPGILYFKENKDLEPNLLVIRIQPREGTFVQFNAKRPGTRNVIIPVQMDFCQNCQVGSNSPEAYERLLYDVMRGDPTLFTRWDEVEYSWRFVDEISKTWEREEPDFPNYASNTWGPEEAEELLRRDGRKWWNL